MPTHRAALGHGAWVEVDDDAGTYRLHIDSTERNAPADVDLEPAEYSALFDLPEGGRLKRAHELARKKR